MSNPDGNRRGIGRGGAIVLAVLVLLLLFAIGFMVFGWNPHGESQALSTHGYIAMGLGVVATLALGIGLMALMFWSNRHGRD